MHNHSTRQTPPGYDEALARLAAPPVAITPEAVLLADAAGRVLAEPIRADRDLPPFHRSMLDGYAVTVASFAASMPVCGRLAAGEPPPDSVPPGHALEIATGAALPPGLDAVVPHEQTDRGDPVRFECPPPEAWSGVHRRGADAASGAVIIEAGTRLGPQHLGLAASVGCAQVVCRPRPKVVLLTSGDEIIDVDATPLPHQVRNANRWQLQAAIAALGGELIDAAHLPDDPDVTHRAVGEGLAAADLLITVGGVSAGRRDEFPAAFAAHAVEPIVEGVRLQPGRPIRVGRAPGGCLVLALPGNPVSALVCLVLFGWPLLEQRAGRAGRLPWRPVTLVAAVRPNPRREAIRPARLRPDGASAEVPRWAGSGDLVHTSATDGLVRLPVQSEPVAPGTTLPFLPWPWSVGGGT